MNRGATSFTLILLLALAVSPLVSSAAPVTGEAVPPAIAETALSYSKALAGGDTATSWKLLSAKSRSEVDAVQWKEAFLQRPRARPPSPNVLLRALATSEPPASLGEVSLRGGEAFIEVTESIQIIQEIVLLKEGDRWLVDLAASDELNTRAAAQVFLDAVGSESGASPAPRPARLPRSGLSMLRTLFAPEAKDYYVLRADVERDRARVTLACDLPIHLVLRAVRLGPGWTVDLSRPLVTIDPTSPDALREAADEADKNACQDQLRRLGRAFQMYAAASEDILPESTRWVDQLRPFLPEGMPLHCPADKAEGISYAMNSNLAGKKRGEVADTPPPPRSSTNPPSTPPTPPAPAKAGPRPRSTRGETWSSTWMAPYAPPARSPPSSWPKASPARRRPHAHPDAHHRGGRRGERPRGAGRGPKHAKKAGTRNSGSPPDMAQRFRACISGARTPAGGRARRTAAASARTGRRSPHRPRRRPAPRPSADGRSRSWSHHPG